MPSTTTPLRKEDLEYKFADKPGRIFITTAADGALEVSITDGGKKVARIVQSTRWTDTPWEIQVYRDNGRPYSGNPVAAFATQPLALDFLKVALHGPDWDRIRQATLSI